MDKNNTWKEGIRIIHFILATAAFLLVAIELLTNLGGITAFRSVAAGIIVAATISCAFSGLPRSNLTGWIAISAMSVGYLFL